MRIHHIDRRALLLSGAALLASGASAHAQSANSADDDFRALVERLADRSRTSRAFLLRRYDASRLSPRGRILYEAILPGAEADANLARMRWGSSGNPYAFSHRYGAYRRAAELRPNDNFRNLIRVVDRETRQMRGDADRGVIAPAFALEATETAVAQATQRVVERGNERELAEALQRQLDAVRALRPRAGSDPGMWRLPDGDDFYAAALQFHLGAPVSSRAAHDRALDRCRDLQAEADTLLRAQGLTRGGVGERLRALARDPRYRYAADDAGKDRAVAEMAERLARVRVLLANVIADAGVTPAEVRRLPANLEANGAAGRRRGTAYEVDLGAPRASWTLPSVVHHELIPGHIYQTPFANSANVPALQERYANGYLEGWSTYAETLAAEQGAFEDDPLGRIGYLQWMLFRMARIVADTGLHAMHWSRDHAIAQLHALQGESIAFVSIEEDVLRFCVQPGFYAAQGLAAFHIEDLRARTRRETRDRFSLQRFHTALLEHGPLSPPGLDQAARAAFNP